MKLTSCRKKLGKEATILLTITKNWRKNMKISKNFTFEEFERSDIATRFNLDNRMTNAQRDAVKKLVTEVLQPARDLLGEIIHINSGYRCKELNEKVGGAYNSQHLKGQAADIGCFNNKVLLTILEAMDFDQLITYWEKSYIQFIHISYVSKQKNRNQIIHKKL